MDSVLIRRSCFSLGIARFLLCLRSTHTIPHTYDCNDFFQAALYQHVQQVAREIADDHPKKKLYVDYANKFRIPYWDWAARSEQIFPKAALDPRTPYDAAFKPPLLSSAGSTKWDNNYNPLATYPFPEGVPNTITVSRPLSLNHYFINLRVARAVGSTTWCNTSGVSP